MTHYHCHNISSCISTCYTLTLSTFSVYHDTSNVRLHFYSYGYVASTWSQGPGSTCRLGNELRYCFPSAHSLSQQQALRDRSRNELTLQVYHCLPNAGQGERHASVTGIRHCVCSLNVGFLLDVQLKCQAAAQHFTMTSSLSTDYRNSCCEDADASVLHLSTPAQPVSRCQETVTDSQMRACLVFPESVTPDMHPVFSHLTHLNTIM